MVLPLGKNSTSASTTQSNHKNAPAGGTEQGQHLSRTKRRVEQQKNALRNNTARLGAALRYLTERGADIGKTLQFETPYIEDIVEGLTSERLFHEGLLSQILLVDHDVSIDEDNEHKVDQTGSGKEDRDKRDRVEEESAGPSVDEILKRLEESQSPSGAAGTKKKRSLSSTSYNSSSSSGCSCTTSTSSSSEDDDDDYVVLANNPYASLLGNDAFTMPDGSSGDERLEDPAFVSLDGFLEDGMNQERGSASVFVPASRAGAPLPKKSQRRSRSRTNEGVTSGTQKKTKSEKKRAALLLQWLREEEKNVREGRLSHPSAAAARAYEQALALEKERKREHLTRKRLRLRRQVLKALPKFLLQNEENDVEPGDAFLPGSSSSADPDVDPCSIRAEEKLIIDAVARLVSHSAPSYVLSGGGTGGGGPDYKLSSSSSTALLFEDFPAVTFGNLLQTRAHAEYVWTKLSSDSSGDSHFEQEVLEDEHFYATALGALAVFVGRQAQTAGTVTEGGSTVSSSSPVPAAMLPFLHSLAAWALDQLQVRRAASSMGGEQGNGSSGDATRALDEDAAHHQMTPDHENFHSATAYSLLEVDGFDSARTTTSSDNPTCPNLIIRRALIGLLCSFKIPFPEHLTLRLIDTPDVNRVLVCQNRLQDHALLREICGS
ncbi:unnamed protein product [Amoebophrya sp. A25]|nr:unnamed protein product [Amoebophrya sp. A25]|eukprot:GSA25T00015506001.1